jgi:glycerol-1-phosphate dehydrogenase [NAD(P)+]
MNMTYIWNLPKIEFIPLSEVEEDRPVLLVTSKPAWEAVCGELQVPVAWQIEVTEAAIMHWDNLLSRRGAAVREPEVVYAVGGGLAADAAKHMAAHLGLPLICLPTALSADAFLTAVSAVREVGCVQHIETIPPDRLIVDLKIIGAAPVSFRAAGICDVLSIATASWDWKFAHERGKNPTEMGFVPYAYENAQSILRGALDCAETAGRGDPQGLRQLLDCMVLEVRLCNQLGHSRPELGSEHYFAFSVENALGYSVPHGNLVAPGILVMAKLQGQNTTPLEKALKACHVPLNQVPEAIMRQTLINLPEYCRKHGLPYGIAHELNIEEKI